MKVIVAPDPVIERIGPDVAKVKAGPVKVVPWAAIVVVAGAPVAKVAQVTVPVGEMTVAADPAAQVFEPAKADAEPLAFVRTKAFVTEEKMVDELKVAVLFAVRPPRKV